MSTTVRLFLLFALLSAVQITANAISAAEIENPTKPGRTWFKVENQVPRTWTDRSGKFSVEATLLEFSADRIRLRRVDTDKVIIVPLHKLRRQDRILVSHVRRRISRPRDSSERETASKKDDVGKKTILARVMADRQ